jgi:hypothetical protein
MLVISSVLVLFILLKQSFLYLNSLNFLSTLLYNTSKFLTIKKHIEEMTKKILIFIAIIGFSACKKSNESVDNPTNIQLDFVKTFEGQIDNKYDIILKITSNEGQIDGNYFYKSVGTNIQVKGNLDINGDLKLNEFDTKGNQTGLFNGKMVNNNKIEGNWSKPNGDKEKPFVLIESNSNYELSKKVKNKQAKPKYDADALNEIKKYYHEQYNIYEGKHTKFEDEFNNIYQTRTYRHVSDEEDEFEYAIVSIYIPLEKDTKSLFYGDLNNDGLQDLVVAVSTEIGAGFDQPAELFVFLNQNNKLTLIDVAEIHGLTHCEDGYFWPTKIENGNLIGTSYCFKNNDGRCCPSLKYSTKTKLSDNKLVFNSQIKIK